MKDVRRKLLGVAGLVALASIPAFASPGPTTRVPEIDPSTGICAIALIGGAAAAIRSRTKA